MEVMRILVTGSRDWGDRTVIWRELDQLWDLASGRFTLVHGDCLTGADMHADYWGRSRHGVEVERHPADWNAPCRQTCNPGHRRRSRMAAQFRIGDGSYCPSAGNYRNQEMVDLGADIVLAFSRNGSRGTADCVRRAKAAGLQVILHEEGQ